MTGSRLALSRPQINALWQAIERALRLAEGYGLASAHESDADIAALARDLRDEVRTIRASLGMDQ